MTVAVITSKPCCRCNRPRAVSASGRVASYCREHLRQDHVEYRRNHLEQRRANSARWARNNPERSRAYAAKYRRLHPEVVLADEHRRRVRKAGLLMVVRVESDVCGICQRPLVDRPYPDPMSTSVGHEPPLAYCAQNGWLVTAERPEHLICNQRKRTRLDIEIRDAQLNGKELPSPIRTGYRP